MMRKGLLTEEPDREGIAVGHPVACAQGGKHHAHDPCDQDNRQDQEADECKTEDDRDSGIDGIGDLEVQNLLAGGINLGTIRPFDKPDHQGCDDMHQRPSQQDPGETRKVKPDAPGAGGLIRAGIECFFGSEGWWCLHAVKKTLEIVCGQAGI